MTRRSRVTWDARHRIARQKIFAATSELIRKMDYADITARMICAEAGISIGMFYRNFPSKDSVLSFIYEEIAETYEAEIRDTLIDLPVRKRLICFYIWLSSFVSCFGLQFVRHFLDANTISVKSDYDNNQAVLIGKHLLDAAVEKGELTLSEGRMSFEVTHDILVIVKGALLDWAISGGAYDLADYVKALLEKTMPALL